jgi:hypothetical protein
VTVGQARVERYPTFVGFFGTKDTCIMPDHG